MTGRPRDLQRSITAWTRTGATHPCAPAREASSSSAGVRTVPARTTSPESRRRRLIVSRAPLESSDLHDPDPACSEGRDNLLGFRGAAEDGDDAFPANGVDDAH